MHLWKTIFLYNSVVFRFHVNCPEYSYIMLYTNYAGASGIVWDARCPDRDEPHDADGSRPAATWVPPQRRPDQFGVSK